MFRQYAVSFLFGSLYKLTNDIYNAEGIRENIPLTIAEIVNALGYTLLTYLSTNNCNIPIALSGTYIIYKKFLGSQPKTVDVSDADAGAGVCANADTGPELVSELIDLVKDKTYDILHKNIKEDISYPPHIAQFIEYYQTATINYIQLRKKPVRGLYYKMLNILSLGHFDIEKIREISDIEDFNHTSMVVGFQHNNRQHYILLEKQNKIIISEKYTTSSNLHYKTIENVAEKSLTFKDFMEKGKEALGENLNNFDIFQNNCQHFLQKMLEANGLLADDVADFIKQKGEYLVDPKINLFVQSIFAEITNITFILLLILAVLNFNYAQLNTFSIVFSISFFCALMKSYEHFFSQKSSVGKIAGFIGTLFVLICAFFINIVFNNKYLLPEMVLFSIAYILVSIGSMITQISKDVFLEVLNKNILSSSKYSL